LGLLLISTLPIYAQKSSGFGKLAEHSPDQEFFVRISRAAETEAYVEEENSFEGTGASMLMQSTLVQWERIRTRI
jgi:hypothetical protein